MTTAEIIGLFNEYVMSNYTRQPAAIVRGQGSRIWDADGREYLDMFPGWAVSGIGHCHPKVVKAISEQAAKLIHIDNTFYSEPQGILAKLLSERAFGGKCFFCNSGAEAVEGALKLARKHTDKKKFKIISAEGGFHGRTMFAMTATAQPQKHEGFLPLVPGFIYVPYNDIDALKKVFDDEVAAVIIEPIQGEGGVQVATKEYLQTIRDLCDEHGALAIWDEVQSGMGRTGTWFAHQLSDVEPDLMTMAKALGGGVAIGALMARPEVAASLTPGSHASTFGGNPLACAAAIATIAAIEEENLLENARQMGDYTMSKLNVLKTRYSCIDHVRGAGLMIGIQLVEPGAEIVKRCWQKGLRINCTQQTVLRFMPSMTVTADEIDRSVGILEESLSELYGG